MLGWMHVCAVDATLLVPYIIETFDERQTDWHRGQDVHEQKGCTAWLAWSGCLRFLTYQAVPHQSCPQSCLFHDETLQSLKALRRGTLGAHVLHRLRLIGLPSRTGFLARPSRDECRVGPGGFLVYSTRSVYFLFDV